MEENNLVEQPESPAVDVSEQITDIKEDDEGAGSTLGKFKDTTSLLSAYNSLQKEFTRKSQKLSQVSKLYDELKTQNQQNFDEKQAQNGENQQKSSKTNTEQRPQFASVNWHRKVASFLESNPDAKQYTKEMSNILLSDKELAKLDGCLDYAFNIARSRATKPVDFDDPSTIESFAGNEKIKKKIIENYLLSMNDNKSNLKFILGEPTSVTLTPTQNKPKTIKEASNILKNLLQS